jgi:hypothetical protein
MGCLLVALFALLPGFSDALFATSPVPPTAPVALSAFPTSSPALDPTLRYVIYLHGRIVEDQGRKAVSPEFGAYELGAILAALGGPGRVVVSELRGKDTDPRAFAAHVAEGIRGLLAAGVAGSRITVVGASKGAVIGMLTSTVLGEEAAEEVGYVVMAGCNEDIAKRFGISLHGRVLSIFERSDSIGRSCAGIFAASKSLGEHREIEIHTGLRHGFLYRPLGEWVGPTLGWIEGRAVARGGAS